GEEEELCEAIEAVPGVKGLTITGDLSFAVDFEGEEEAQAQLLIALQNLGLMVVSFKESGVALESLYMSLIMDSR
ncbi:MAG TPA: hypothetical protein P5063_07970, partial [Methanomassiliicoccales archaeon]|nr:hypothetical protein [Methanomassiliicoccales archaeon]